MPGEAFAVHFLWACVACILTALLCSEWNVPEVKLLREQLERDSDMLIATKILADQLEGRVDDRATVQAFATLTTQVQQHGAKLQALETARRELEAERARTDALNTSLATQVEELAKVKKRLGELELGTGMRANPTRPNRG